MFQNINYLSKIIRLFSVCFHTLELRKLLFLYKAENSFVNGHFCRKESGMSLYYDEFEQFGHWYILLDFEITETATARVISIFQKWSILILYWNCWYYLVSSCVYTKRCSCISFNHPWNGYCIPLPMSVFSESTRKLRVN